MALECLQVFADALLVTTQPGGTSSVSRCRHPLHVPAMPLKPFAHLDVSTKRNVSGTIAGLNGSVDFERLVFATAFWNDLVWIW